MRKEYQFKQQISKELASKKTLMTLFLLQAFHP